MTFPIYHVSMVHTTDPTMSLHFHDKMFRTEADAATHFADIEPYLKAIVDRQLAPEDFALSFKLTHHETWCLTWFSHYTFRDRFDLPTAALADFEDYVHRVQMAQGFSDRLTPDGITEYERRTGKRWICLMGAEDRWRWRGKEDGSSAPCACQECVTSGIWTVVH